MRDIPAQAGRRAVVTGGTSGIGFEVSAALAAAGAEVVLVGRDAARGRAALERLHGRASRDLVRFEEADLGDATAVRLLADRLLDEGGRLDLLINNAGIMAPPQRETTPAGVELQFQVNYLSHFLLTGLLMPRLQRASAARVVSVSSLIAQRLDLEDAPGAAYDPFRAYGRTKSAMLAFAFALQRRAETQGWRLTSSAAHPGWAQTALMEPEKEGATLMKTMIAIATPMFGQPAAEGALPILYAATAPAATPGYYGPAGVGGLRGPPRAVPAPAYATDAAVQDRLWALSEDLTGFRWG